MSEYSSVKTSRINSPMVALRGAKSEAVGTASSGMTRISMREALSAAAQKLEHGSVRTSVKSRISLSSKLCEFLEANVVLDEYGFTDKTCRKCANRLALEELIALCVPLAPQGPDVDLSQVKIDENAMICLSCYADIVSKRAELKKSPLKPAEAKETAKSASRPQTNEPKPPTAPGRTTEGKPQTAARSGSATHAPLLPAVKPPSPAQIKSSTANALQRKKRAFSSNPGRVYDIVKSKGRSREAPHQNNRKKTDITHYADAVYAGGVFKHAPPGQSM